ncbi:MAG: phytanoyl-CoA dioxygenase family protein [Pseudomonadota bacterium]
MDRRQIQLVEHDQLTPWLQGRSFESWKTQLDEEGYIIFEGAMPPEEVQRVRNALAPYLTKPGRNNFEGFNSHRVYALLAKAPDVFSDMITHPLALAFAEAELGEACLLSALLAINSGPGETVQPWHRDDGAPQIPMPRPAFGVSTFWAIDDTTETNGATEIIPGSHLRTDLLDNDERAADYRNMSASEQDVNYDPQPRTDAVKVTLKSGALMVAKGNLMHRGGANKSDKSRLIVTPQYCPGWARQIETMLLSVPKEVAAKLPRRVRQLIGYNITGAFMGYVDGIHPERVLDLESHG